ncbi:cell envelope integrity protein TolA [Shewanella algae]|uniref:cell envelope integrity protein TolA n=1 Tax=Shewanella algae TaxID=38313 RepID=UPI003B67465E
MAGKSDFTVPFIISAVLHIGVIAILAMGVDFQDKPKLPTPQAQSAPVQAVVVDQQKVDDYVQKLKQDKAAAERRERERQQELDRKANEAKKAREQEQERIRKLEVERKQKELETQKAADAAKAAKLKEQQEKEKAQKAEAERKAKEQQRKEAEEAALKAEQKRKAEEEARRRQEQELADALAAEQAALSATRNRQVMSEVDRYRAMITATIQRNLVVDESMRGKVCKVKVRLAKDGFVTNSQIIEGDPVVCRAAKAAINKAGRLPVSQEPDVYQLMKEINLQVRPEFN